LMVTVTTSAAWPSVIVYQAIMHDVELPVPMVITRAVAPEPPLVGVKLTVGTPVIPLPGLLIWIEVTTPPETVAVAVGIVPVPLKLTVGAARYPLPPAVSNTWITYPPLLLPFLIGTGYQESPAVFVIAGPIAFVNARVQEVVCAPHAANIR